MADLEMDLRPVADGEIHLMPYLMQRLIIVAGAASVTPWGLGGVARHVANRRDRRIPTRRLFEAKCWGLKALSVLLALRWRLSIGVSIKVVTQVRLNFREKQDK